MSHFNLLESPWLPILCKNGQVLNLRPSDITRSDLVRPSWPRPDLDIGCLELLVGLVYIACPPKDRAAWIKGFSSPPDLEAALSPLKPAFDLLGEGPCFMQDLAVDVFAKNWDDGEPSDEEGDDGRLDVLFMDSAGANTARLNSDILVHRGRYETGIAMDPGFAAMALYVLQTQAPSGGAGYRVSLRGGGPLITMVDPGTGSLWDLIWANVPYGEPIGSLEELPWMRPLREGQVFPVRGQGEPVDAETFFGMPRRVRLKGCEDGIQAALQIARGNNYVRWAWRHPLTPHRIGKEETNSVLTDSIQQGYRNWAGTILEVSGRHLPADTVTRWKTDMGRDFRIILSGWQMEKAKAKTYLHSETPVTPDDFEQEAETINLIEAAEIAACSTCAAIMKSVDLAPGAKDHEKADDAVRKLNLDLLPRKGASALAAEAFFRRTETAFRAHLRDLKEKGKPTTGKSWHDILRKTAFMLFEEEVTSKLGSMEIARRKIAVQQHRSLAAVFGGYGKAGARIRQLLDIELSQKKETHEHA